LKVTGVVIHHSVCSSINGKGYDFYISKEGAILPASEPTEPGGRLHICLEGNFALPETLRTTEAQEQLFLALKLISQVAEENDLPATPVMPHSGECPGALFPWEQLVLSMPDRYH